jgi:DNA-binding NtrC family response regulator
VAKESRELSKVELGDTFGERVKALAICHSGAKELGLQLAMILQPAQTVDLTLENPPPATRARTLSFLTAAFLKHQPQVVLLCLPDGGATRLELAELIFEAQEGSRTKPAIIGIFERPDTNDPHGFIAMGAVDFCVAPLRIEELLPRMMRWSAAVTRTQALTRELEEKLGLQRCVGVSRAFREALQTLPRLARCDASVLILGETGTGKEMCARAIHQLGRRADHPFIPVNCGAIPSELVENELFGHDAGAFTGAASSVRGLVHDAEGGTLFLDEIDSLPLGVQVKFLRFLQDQEYRPLGGRKALQADVRIITACNADLEAMAHSGKFRVDLFYRLNILPLKLPALRERREDIPVLARHFMEKFAGELAMPPREISRAALEKLQRHAWPGNVRELENIIERAMVLSENPLLTAEDIRLPGNQPSPEKMSFKALKARAIAEFETEYIRHQLEISHNNISLAARAAQKNRRAFWQLMRKHNMVAPGMVAPGMVAPGVAEADAARGQTRAPARTFLS